MERHMMRCHGRLHYDRKFQIFIFLIGHINVNKGAFCLIISYLQIKNYNVLNYNNCSTDWPFPLRNSQNISQMSFRLSMFKESYFPVTSKLWNSLDLNLGQMPIFSSFKVNLRKLFFQLKKNTLFFFFYRDRYF